MRYLTLVCFLLSLSSISSQSDYYLVGEEASINTVFSDNPEGDGGMLFEARPIARYKFHNNIKSRIKDKKSSSFSTSYLLFSPHIRMYNENSEPVKMPSYRVAAGFQQVWRVKTKDTLFHEFMVVGGEHGHYSNGQSGCAFDRRFEDGTSDCNAVYNNVNGNQDVPLTDRLNRSNGHFQTNYTSLFVNFRDLKKNDTAFVRSQSLNVKYTLYHRNMIGFLNFGGYSQNDIQIYGKHRYEIDYSYSWLISKYRVWKLGQSLSFIDGAHRSVTTYRSVTSLTYYPWTKHVNLGIKMAYIRGHDDYNIRFVDDISHFTIGAVFSPFELFSMNNN